MTVSPKPATVTLTHALFSGQGRLRRRDYWLYSILIFFVYVIVVITVSLVAAMLWHIQAADVSAVCSPIYIGPRICITAKRWHDRGRSGYLAGLSILGLVYLGIEHLHMASLGGINMAVAGLYLTYGLWSLIECGILDGTPGFNRYGPSSKGLNRDDAVL